MDDLRRMFAEGEAAEAAGATAAGASGLSNYAMAYSKEHSRKSELSRAVILIAKSETTLKFGLKTLRAFPFLLYRFADSESKTAAAFHFSSSRRFLTSQSSTGHAHPACKPLSVYR